MNYNPGKKTRNAAEKKMVAKINELINEGVIKDAPEEITSFQELKELHEKALDLSVETASKETVKSEESIPESNNDFTFDSAPDNPMAEPINPERIREVQQKAMNQAAAFSFNTPEPEEVSDSEFPENNKDVDNTNSSIDNEENVDLDDRAPVAKEPWEIEPENSFPVAGEENSEAEIQPESESGEGPKNKLSDTATKQMVSTGVDLLCSGIEWAGRKVACVDIWKLRKLEMAGKLNLQMPIMNDGTTVEQWAKNHNNAVDSSIVIDDESREDLINATLLVAEKHNFEVTPEMNLGLTLGAIIVKVGSSAIALRNDSNKMLKEAQYMYETQFKKIEELQKENERLRKMQEDQNTVNEEPIKSDLDNIVESKN